MTDERSGTGEFKAVAQDAMRLGARALETGRAWLSGRRETMNERDASRRYEERLRQQRHESGMAGSEHGARRWGAGEDWDDNTSARTQGHYAGDYEAGARMGRQYASGMGRDEQDWSQGRRESQRWGEQGTYGAQGRNEYERGGDYGRERAHRGQFGDRGHGDYGSNREYGNQGYGASNRGRAYGTEYGSQRRYENQQQDDYGNQRGYGTQAHGQGEHSSGSHGYGSGREYRGYEGGEAGRQAGNRNWERGYGEGYGLSSGYADQQAYGREYGTSGYATGYASDNEGARPTRQHSMSGTSRGEYGRNYRGVGPRSYTRSDERVLEDINERLTEDDYLDATDVTVRCVNGVITLEGTVAERWMKHRAEDLADASSGVKQVDNRLQVQSQRSASEQRTGESTTAQGRASTTRQTGGTTASGSSSTRGTGNDQGTSQH